MALTLCKHVVDRGFAYAALSEWRVVDCIARSVAMYGRAMVVIAARLSLAHKFIDEHGAVAVLQWC